MIKRLFGFASLGVAVLGLCSTTAAEANGLDIALGNDTANLVYLTDSASMGYGGADLGFGAFFNNDDDVMLTGKFLVTGSPGRDVPLQYGVGAKGFLTDLDSGNDAHALGLGGQVRYLLPTEPTMALSVEGYYAPDITSFGDAESFYELNPRFEVEIVPSTRAFVGYRLIKADLKDGGDEDISDEFQVGIRLTF